MTVYKEEFGKYPIGEDAAAMKFLLGNNPKHELFVRLDSRKPHAINENGQCVDGWGIPFRIDVASTNGLVIRSAGMNKIFDDKDDIIFDSVSNGFGKP